MNQTLYYADPYLKETQCKVVSVICTDKCTQVITDKTIFYPECGGQPGDRGTLGSYSVLDTRKADNGDSILVLEPNCGVKVGDELTLKLDWSHRYKYMKMHTAQHLLSGLLFSVLHIGTVAVHLGEEYLTIETERSSISKEEIETLVQVANVKIAEAHKVIYREMSHKEAEALGLRRSIKVDGDVRIVEIEDVDRIACGGVHVSKTSELSLVMFVGTEQIRGHVRLFFKTGEQALQTVFGNQRTVDCIREKFSCSEAEVLPKIENLLLENSENKKNLTELSAKLAEIEIKEHLNNSVSIFETSLEVSAFTRATENFKDLALFVYNKTHWLIAFKGKYETVDFNKIRTELFPTIGAKGGGRLPIFQGVYSNPDGLPTFCSSFESLVTCGS